MIFFFFAFFVLLFPFVASYGSFTSVVLQGPGYSPWGLEKLLQNYQFRNPGAQFSVSINSSLSVSTDPLASTTFGSHFLSSQDRLDGILGFPLIFTPLVVVVHLPGLTVNVTAFPQAPLAAGSPALLLTAEALPALFSGNLTRWGDPRLARVQSPAVRAVLETHADLPVRLFLPGEASAFLQRFCLALRRFDARAFGECPYAADMPGFAPDAVRVPDGDARPLALLGNATASPGGAAVVPMEVFMDLLRDPGGTPLTPTYFLASSELPVVGNASLYTAPDVFSVTTATDLLHERIAEDLLADVTLDPPGPGIWPFSMPIALFLRPPPADATPRRCAQLAIVLGVAKWVTTTLMLTDDPLLRLSYAWLPGDARAGVLRMLHGASCRGQTLVPPTASVGDVFTLMFIPSERNSQFNVAALGAPPQAVENWFFGVGNKTLGMGTAGMGRNRPYVIAKDNNSDNSDNSDNDDDDNDYEVVNIPMAAEGVGAIVNFLDADSPVKLLLSLPLLSQLVLGVPEPLFIHSEELQRLNKGLQLPKGFDSAQPFTCVMTSGPHGWKAAFAQAMRRAVPGWRNLTFPTDELPLGPTSAQVPLVLDLGITLQSLALNGTPALAIDTLGALSANYQLTEVFGSAVRSFGLASLLIYAEDDEVEVAVEIFNGTADNSQMVQNAVEIGFARSKLEREPDVAPGIPFSTDFQVTQGGYPIVVVDWLVLPRTVRNELALEQVQQAADYAAAVLTSDAFDDVFFTTGLAATRSVGEMQRFALLQLKRMHVWLPGSARPEPLVSIARCIAETGELCAGRGTCRSDAGNGFGQCVCDDEHYSTDTACLRRHVSRDDLLTSLVIGLVFSLAAALCVAALVVCLVLALGALGFRRMRRKVRQLRTDLSDVLAEHALQEEQGYRELDFDDLVVQELIGEGAFGEVHRGLWLGADVAIKLLRPRNVTEEVLASVRAEARLMTRLGNHPNIVLFIGAVTTDARHLCLVTELCPRGSLDRYCPLRSQRDALRAAAVLARSLHFLHAENVLHRDVAARNVLVAADGTLRLADFGLGQILDGQAKHHLAGEDERGAGPVRWMAPESLRQGTFSPKSDVYMFGVLLWELYCGGLPFEEITMVQVIMQKTRAPALQLEPPGAAPPGLQALMRRCWSEDPDDRPNMLEASTFIVSSLPPGIIDADDLVSKQQLEMDDDEDVSGSSDSLSRNRSSRRSKKREARMSRALRGEYEDIRDFFVADYGSVHGGGSSKKD